MHVYKPRVARFVRQSRTRNLQVDNQITNGEEGTVLDSHPVATFSIRGFPDSSTRRGLQIGAPAGNVVAPVYLKVNGTGSRFALVNQSNVETMTVLDNGRVGIDTNAPPVSLYINRTDAIRIPIGITSQRPVPAEIGMMRVNTELNNVLEYYNGIVWELLSGFIPIQASGGTVEDVVINDSPFRVHIFSTPGSSTLSVSSLGTTNGSFEFLVVAGGGGGGGYGGGGAGGLRSGSGTLSATSYSITVGAGGSGLVSTNLSGAGDVLPFSGANSALIGTGISITSAGGGRGGSDPGSASAGGSGGGGNRNVNAGNAGGAGNTPPTSPAQGTNGGNGEGNGLGGGGGGATQAGANAVSDQAGKGGNGSSTNFDGVLTVYAGGGGAGANRAGGGGNANYLRGLGGSGGGGNGQLVNDGTVLTFGSAGVNGLGGGGGGAGRGFGLSAFRGGNGIVLVRYPLGNVFVPIAATGGTISDVIIGGIPYRVHTFTVAGSSEFAVSSVGTSQGSVEYLVVAGGGAGSCGGGGAGGVLTDYVSLSAGNYPIVVGNGGTGLRAVFVNSPQLGTWRDERGTNGGNSSALSFTAVGGGAGGAYGDGGVFVRDGANGGSGGGGGGLFTDQTNTAGGNGTSGQGSSGGQSSNDINAGAGGGGGAGGAGSNGTGSGGAGGIGIQSNINGSNTFYGGGGSGGSITTSSGTVAGGLGGGGFGMNNAFNSNSPSGNGTPNTGGGGGGTGGDTVNANGNGGSGIVIIAYALTNISIP